MEKYETIIWDWNGTLLDDVGLALRVMNRLLAEHGYSSLNRLVYTQIFDFPVRGYYERAGFDLGQHDFETLSNRFCREFEDGLNEASLFTGTRETVSKLSRYRQFILSGTEQAALDRMLKAFEILRCFESAHGLADNLASGKTSVATELVQSKNLEPKTTILIGDTTHDAEVAEAMRVDCLLVASGHNSRRRLVATGHPVIESLHEVEGHLSRGPGR